LPHYLAFVRDRAPSEFRKRGIDSFTFWKMAEAADFNGFGVTHRQLDRDFVTLKTNSSKPAVDDVVTVDIGD
jgi:hypothetical protein